MDPYVLLWFLVLLGTLAAEAATVSLVSLWFAGGALAALIAALCGAGFVVQLVLFTAVSAVLLGALWPLRRKLLEKRRPRVNLDRVVGMTAVVTEAVDNVEGRGAVKVDGKVWSARSEHGETLEPGDLVRVLRIEGVKLYVEKLPVSVR